MLKSALWLSAASPSRHPLYHRIISLLLKIRLVRRHEKLTHRAFIPSTFHLLSMRYRRAVSAVRRAASSRPRIGIRAEMPACGAVGSRCPILFRIIAAAGVFGFVLWRYIPAFQRNNRHRQRIGTAADHKYFRFSAGGQRACLSRHLIGFTRCLRRACCRGANKYDIDGRLRAATPATQKLEHLRVNRHHQQRTSAHAYQHPSSASLNSEAGQRIGISKANAAISASAKRRIGAKQHFAPFKRRRKFLYPLLEIC